MTWEPSQKDPYGWCRQAAMREFALDKSTYPLRLRLGFIALSRAGKNRHANFKEGELERLMKSSRDELTKGIKRAVKDGWLEPSSMTTDHRCLILSGDRFRGYGKAATCKICEKDRQPNPCKSHG